MHADNCNQPNVYQKQSLISTTKLRIGPRYSLIFGCKIIAGLDFFRKINTNCSVTIIDRETCVPPGRSGTPLRRGGDWGSGGGWCGACPTPCPGATSPAACGRRTCVQTSACPTPASRVALDTAQSQGRRTARSRRGQPSTRSCRGQRSTRSRRGQRRRLLASLSTQLNLKVGALQGHTEVSRAQGHAEVSGGDWSAG